ncbi:hypothetical protein HU200_048122 [Digitaria exilis]|uniref:Uncharacterized protein n=1 Tax=Digitaria exilis TaxID=1010633 RepID=A0A835EC69_9POAL|nr:hypothetical protein HU200_048122 [Digitaria exilis]
MQVPRPPLGNYHHSDLGPAGMGSLALAAAAAQMWRIVRIHQRTYTLASWPDHLLSLAVVAWHVS